MLAFILVSTVPDNGRIMTKNCGIAFAFVVGAILIFLVYLYYLQVSPHPAFASLGIIFPSRLVRNSTDIPSQTNDSLTTMAASIGKTAKPLQRSTLASEVTSSSAATATTTQTLESKSGILLAKNEPKLLSPIDFDQKGAKSKFLRITSKTEVKHYVDLLRKLDELFKKAGLTYFLHCGTLLGSYRHFGFIPWDDDIDVLVPYVEKDKTLKALSVPGYECITAQGIRWKFDYKSDKLIRKDLSWRWPFIDISFYKEKGTDIWDIGFPEYRFKKDWVFPLTKRPFEGYWFNAPKNTLKCLQKNIDLTMCVTANWNHRHEHGNSKLYSEKCDKFRPYYAFVNRTKLADGKVKETLTFRSRVLQEVIFDHT
jgi:hypothetical protein